MTDGPLGMIVLAAGRSRRFGSEDKRLARLPSGRTVLESTLDQVTGAVDETLVVVRPDDDEVIKMLSARHDLDVVTCANADLGMGHSLAAGAAQAIRRQWRAAFVMLADMPFVKPETLTLLAAELDSTSDAAIVQPENESKPGHPVLFHARYFEEISALTGDEGAKSIIAKHRLQLRRIPVTDPGILADIDLPSDLR